MSMDRKCNVCGTDDVAVHVDVPTDRAGETIQRWYCRRHLSGALSNARADDSLTVTNLTSKPVVISGRIN